MRDNSAGSSAPNRARSLRSAMKLLRYLVLFPTMVFYWTAALAVEEDRATHQSDHAEDVNELPEVHVHGLPLNKDQQLGPVPTYTPWPKIPAALEGKELDDWMKARLLVDKEGQVTVMILEPAKHRELSMEGMAALKQWRFKPQLRVDVPVDGELTVRIHFKTK